MVALQEASIVKRRKVEDVAGVLEFEVRTAEDPEIATWLAEHRARKEHGGRGDPTKRPKGRGDSGAARLTTPTPRTGYRNQGERHADGGKGSWHERRNSHRGIAR